jgi:hypothetical protein
LVSAQKTESPSYISVRWTLSCQGYGDLDDFTACDIAGAPHIAATGAIASGLKKNATGDAGPHLNLDRRKVRESTRMIFEFDVFDDRGRQSLDLVQLKFSLDFLRHQQGPLYTHLHESSDVGRHKD